MSPLAPATRLTELEHQPFESAGHGPARDEEWGNTPCLASVLLRSRQGYLARCRAASAVDPAARNGDVTASPRCYGALGKTSCVSRRRASQASVRDERLGFIAGCLSIIVAACVCLLAITACGSSNSRPSASGSASNPRLEGIEFSDCMRSHGVPNFPDPNAQGEIPGNFDLQSPQAQAAQTKCKKFEPSGRSAPPSSRRSSPGRSSSQPACARTAFRNSPTRRKPTAGWSSRSSTTPRAATSTPTRRLPARIEGLPGDLPRASLAAGLPPPPSLGPVTR